MLRPEFNPDSDRTTDRPPASDDSKIPYEGKGKRPVNRQNSKKKPHFLTDAEKQAELVRFTENNLVSRRCARYASASYLRRKSGAKRFQHEEELPCECGMSYAWHVKHNYVRTTDNHDTKWDIKTHGKDTITREHGVIGFRDTCGEDHDHPRPYVRVKSDVSYKLMYELLTEHWSFPTPKLVLVISGNVDLTECEQSTSRQLELALSDIIKSTGAWVITDGLSGGLTTCVGNAVRECASVSGQTAYEDFVLLGICSWDSVDGIASLICDEDGGRFPADYHKVHKATSSSFSQPGTSRKSQAATYKASKNRKKLDENHTHFIFVDGDDPLKWRRNFENYIASNRTIISHKEMDIPVIRLLIDCGGDHTKLDSSYFNPGIPNLIILLDDYFGEDSHFEQFIEPGSKKVQRSTEEESPSAASGTGTESADNDIMTGIKTEPQKMIRYVNFQHSSTGAALIREFMEAAVEEAKYPKSSLDSPQSDISISFDDNDDSITKLMLAVVLKQPDYARYNVLHSAVDCQALLDDSLHDLFSYFLINNDYKFIELFIDCGIELGQFLTLNRLNVLYDQVHEQCSENSLVKFLFSLVYMKHESSVGDSWTKLKYVGELLRDLTTSNFENEYDVKGQNIEHSCHSNPFKTPAEQHLLLWAALFNRDHLAKIFWRRGVNHIGMALVVWRLSSELSHKASRQNLQDVADAYEEQKRIFEKLAVSVLDECFRQNPRLTIVSLTRQAPTLFGSSALAIATDAEVNSFTEHASCQLAITRQWNGNMSPYTSWIKVAFAIFFPFLPCVRYMRRDELEPRCDDEEHFDPGLVRSVPDASTRVREKSEMERKSNVSFYKIGLYKGHSSIAPWKAIWFFVNAPVTKFVYHATSYLFFLIVLSIFVLTELSPIDDTTVISPLEYITWIWLAGLIVDEVQQVAFSAGNTIGEKLKKYFFSGWNVLDTLMNALLLCAIALRFSRTTPFSYARGLYVIAETLCIIRIIHISLVTEVFGIKVRMLLEMAKDVRNFLIILAVFMFSFGIAYRSLLYPEAQLNENLLWNIMFRPYFILFGQIPTDEFVKGQVSGCNSSIHSTLFGENDACPQQNNWLASVYLAIYCFVSNIMLVNLLIASLGQTFERVQERSEKIWRSERYSLVEEFHRRSWLILPLNIIAFIWNVILSIIRCCKGSKLRSNNNEVELTERGRRRIELFEKAAMESCWAEEWTSSSREEEWLINSRAALFCKDDSLENEAMLTHITQMESSLDSVSKMWNPKPLNIVKNSLKTLRRCRTCTKKRPKD